MQIKPVGLTGGIATGKTTVAKRFRELGAVVLSGDNIAARVLAPGSQVLHELACQFGSAILLKDGSLNRRVMLTLLLEDHENMQIQLDILAPHLLPVIDDQVKRSMDANSGRLHIVEAPLLFEYGQAHRYEPVVVVSTSYETQVKRLMARSGKDITWAKKVIGLQWSIEKKKEYADLIIENDEAMEVTNRFIEDSYSRLCQYWGLSENL